MDQPNRDLTGCGDNSRTAVRELPRGYNDALKDILDAIRSSRLEAAAALNQRLVGLYWRIGEMIVERQRRSRWGRSVVDRLALDIQRAFPGMAGYSPRNVWRMRAFYLAWYRINSDAAVSELGGQAPARVVLELPWGHNIALLQKIAQPASRLWYAQTAVEHGWSRAVLIHQIESRLHERQGRAITNFKRTLPAAQSDLAQALLKDPYTFDFLGLADDAHERDLERGLLDHAQKFLLELGVGFAFEGRQARLEVDGQELKSGEFKPEHAGKMGFYLAAVDAQLRRRGDRPSLGLILCRSKSGLIAEYALRAARKPIGVSAYALTRELPKRLQGPLPTVGQLKAELGGELSPCRGDN